MVQNKEIPQTGATEIITDANGDGTVAVTFKNPMANATYYADAGIQEADITGNLTIGSKTINGMTLVLDGSAVLSTELIDASSVNVTINDRTKEVIDASGNTVTFADADPDTIVRTTGDWTKTFAVGDILTVAGSTSNDGTYLISAVVALTITLTLTVDVLAAETNTTTTITFTPTTPTIASDIVRASGDWRTLFAVGEAITVSDDGASTNAGTYTITVLTATIMTLTLSTDVVTQEANVTDTFTFVSDNGVDVTWIARQNEW